MLFRKLIDVIKPKKTKIKEEVEIKEEAFKEEIRPKIRIEKLTNYSDVVKIQEFLREGEIVFLNIKELKNSNLSELKKAVDRLKNTVSAMDGDIVGVDENYLLLTPGYAKIQRG
ncbi:MAG: cell division protein SepF [Candidatus Aenigmarchaeota archaeon]|jgi:SepF-like predicted cell division protein (DUF552 family)|nr:cell division protein SepF [Candidatus Aenigmarchaeota archaeon]